MNKILDLFDTDTWKTLAKKPLLYAGFHKKNGSSYLVVSTKNELMFVQQFDDIRQTHNDVIEQMRDFTSNAPVIFNQNRTAYFFKDCSIV
jgi:hypothetical protein